MEPGGFPGGAPGTTTAPSLLATAAPSLTASGWWGEAGTPFLTAPDPSP